jgi:hypothetical protein
MKATPTDRIIVPPKEVISTLSQGGVTLVLGAGISVTRGVPNWEQLAKELWRHAFPSRRSPWDVPLDTKAPSAYSQFLPIVFELVYRKLGDKEFLKALGKFLYKNVKGPEVEPAFNKSDETLAVLGRVISRDFAEHGRRRIDSVITLNIDDLLERAVERTRRRRDPDVDVRAIGRSTHPPYSGRGDQPIPVYHIHGFLPGGRRMQHGQNYEHMLVFTDAQYWSSSGTALSFANRVVAWALSESRCVLIGLSMTDINLLRWLALRTNEFAHDKAEASKRRELLPGEEQYNKQSYVRHYWIRPKADDPTGFLSEFLYLRGIQSVEIAGWKGSSLRELMDRCFPDDTPASPLTKKRKK